MNKNQVNSREPQMRFWAILSEAIDNSRARARVVYLERATAIGKPSRAQAGSKRLAPALPKFGRAGEEMVCPCRQLQESGQEHGKRITRNTRYLQVGYVSYERADSNLLNA